MNFLMITNDPILAQHSELAGINRIFIDLERNGKAERQGHLDTFISTHCMSDIAPVKAVLNQAELLVRLNPLHNRSYYEIEQALECGADIIMLPMFTSADEVSKFSNMIDGRAKFIPLIETKEALENIDSIVNVKGIDEIFIGLNDLHLQMELTFMFELLSKDYFENIVRTIRSAGIPFGFGGIARIGEGAIPAEMVLSEHLRMGSSSVILSRAFRDSTPIDFNLDKEIQKLNLCINELSLRTVEQIKDDEFKFNQKVNDFVKGRLC